MSKNYQETLFLELDDKINSVVKELPYFLEGFFKAMKTRNASQRTRLQYAYDLRRYFEFLASSKGFKGINIYKSSASVLDKLKFEDIQEYLDTLETYEEIDKDGKTTTHVMSPSAKARKISSLRSMYNFLFKTGQIKYNPAALLEIPKIPDKNIVAIDGGDVDRILKAVNDTSDLKGPAKAKAEKTKTRDTAILVTLFGTGIRVSELIGLDLNDVDMYNASFVVKRKGGDEDEVMFGEEVQLALQQYIGASRDNLLAGKEEPALFISLKKNRIDERTVETLVKKYANKAGINVKVTPHTCRRTYGTFLYSQTQDIYLVAESLHHSSVETTRRHYAKMSQDRKRQAASIASGLVNIDKQKN